MKILTDWFYNTLSSIVAYDASKLHTWAQVQLSVALFPTQHHTYVHWKEQRMVSVADPDS